MIVYPQNRQLTFSGFCIRYRILNKGLIPTYLAHLFRVPNFKKSMLQNGRGANIQNINQQLLESLIVPIPSPSLQTEFANKVTQLEKVKSKIDQSKTKIENLYAGLSQLAFKGELDFTTAVDLEVLLENDYQFFKENSNSSTIRLLLERLNTDELNENRFYERQTYNKAKIFVFELIKEGKVKQVFDEKTKKVKLTI